MPSKVQVVEELKRLGVTYDESAPHSELIALLKKAQGDEKPEAPPVKPPEDGGETKSGTEKVGKQGAEVEEVKKGVILSNVRHNGVMYKKGTSPDLDAGTAKTLRAEGLLK